MANIQDLYDFIERAAKSHKYAENTAWSLKTAIKKFEPILNDQERSSIKEFKANLDTLTQKMFQKDKNSSASSLTAYKSRAAKVISDYEKYGNDATKMANWTVKTIIRSRRTSSKKEDVASAADGQQAAATPAGMARFDLPLRPDAASFVLVVPPDLTEQEKNIIKGLLDSLNLKK